MGINIMEIIPILIVMMDMACVIDEFFKKKNKRNIALMNLINYKRRCNLLFVLYTESVMKECWKKDRSQSFWEIDCQNETDSFFKTNMRMNRKSFGKLCKLLKNLEKVDTTFRKAIPLEKRVAIALYALGSSAEYRTIGNMFGVGKSTVCTIVLDFCREIWKQLKPLYLSNFPLTTDKVQQYVKGFESMGFPQCLGAIDGCHIEIHPRQEDAVDYYNYKGWYSTVLLALVDSRCRFIYINVGSPGRCNDSQIYEKSLLKQEVMNSSVLKDMAIQMNNINVPVCLIGDSAFKIGNDMMKPYPFNVAQPEDKKHFNYKLSKCRRVVENAFGHLKARFRRIGKGIDNQVDHASLIIKACCALHNFLNEENDDVNQTWLATQQARDRERPAPECTVITQSSGSAEDIRKALTSYLCK